jgi:hypothetical protein
MQNPAANMHIAQLFLEKFHFCRDRRAPNGTGGTKSGEKWKLIHAMLPTPDNTFWPDQQQKIWPLAKKTSPPIKYVHSG